MTESDRKEARKAMAFDIMLILDKTPDKTYTTEEIKQIVTALALNAD